ncbi:MAG: heme ABC exporter ATP-binding protein CcmA [Alphaproteobacteria bacterium]|nr:heme ABC exporter ATP-binding protein CcmA [Alphaproteobacteria bacterium]
MVSDLAVVRGGRVVFQRLGFHIGAGELLSLEGPNGAGKTSLLRVLAGFLPAFAGRIDLTLADATHLDGDERAHVIGWLGHQDGIKSQLSVQENLAFYARLYGQRGADLHALLDQVGLMRARDLPGQYLSAGMRRRLALARLVVSARPVWLLDEPLAALDVRGKAMVGALITAHRRHGGLVIAATHEALGLDCTRLELGAS